jgi:hypothetical protein
MPAYSASTASAPPRQRRNRIDFFMLAFYERRDASGKDKP